MKNFQNMKWYKQVIFATVIIILSPIIVVSLVIVLIGFLMFFIIPSPIERKKYIRSAYFNRFQTKYRIGITKTNNFLLFDQLSSKNISINELKLDYGHTYLYDDERVYIWVYYDDIRFDDKNLTWKLSSKKTTKFIDLEQFITESIAYYREEDKHKKIILLIQEDILNDLEYEIALTDDRFIIYNDMKDLANNLI